MNLLAKFDSLVKEATNQRTSDLSIEIRAMLLFAKENAQQEDIENFMEWLGEETIWDNKGIIETTSPEDNFECLEGMSWQDLLDWYEENN